LSQLNKYIVTAAQHLGGANIRTQFQEEGWGRVQPAQQQCHLCLAEGGGGKNVTDTIRKKVKRPQGPPPLLCREAFV